MRKKIFMILLSIALIVTMMPLSSYAASSGSVETGRCGPNATYTFDGETFTISGSGEARMEDYETTGDDGYWCYEENAFQGTKYLKIGKDITSVSIMYNDVDNLEAIYVDESNTAYKSVDGILFSKDGSKLVKFPAQKETEDYIYTVPKEVTEIERYSFEKNKYISEIKFENGSNLENLPGHAFADCESLKKITIPAGVTMSGNVYVDSFSGCKSLEEINVAEDNQAYSSIDGVLFSKDGEQLMRFPEGKKCANNTYKVPDGVKEICDTAFESNCYVEKIEFGEDTSLEKIGDHAFKGSNSLVSIALPENLTEIGSNAFEGCSSLSSITLPKDLTKIDYGTFEGCTSLTNITLPEGLTVISFDAFAMCTSLTSITLPESLTTIGSKAFANCESLLSISIPASVTLIGESAFGILYETYEAVPEDSYIKEINVDDENQTYKSIDGVLFSKDGTQLIEFPLGKKPASSTYTVPKAVKEICRTAFEDNFHIENIVFEKESQLEEIGTYAFLDCSSLKSITLPEHLKKIGNRSFLFCEKLEKVIFQGENVRAIGSTAFARCDALESIEIPEGVTTISKDAFYGCSSLSNVTLPDTIKKIKENAFRKCSALQTINLPNSITEIGNRAFQDCKKLENVTLPTSLETLGALAFYNTGVKNITIPSGLTSIEPETFAYTSLESVTLPNNVRSVGYSAFMNCSNLTSVNLPSTVRDINYATFENCLNLSKINLENTENVWKEAFSGCQSLKSISITDNTKSLGYKAFDIPNLMVTFTGAKLPTIVDSFATSAKLKGACDAGWTDELKNNYDITLVHAYSDGTCIKCGKAEEKGSYSGGGGGGGAIVIPVTSEDVANKAEDKAAGTSATTTATVKSTTTTSKDGTKTSSATIDTTTANKIVEKAVENKSEVVVIDTAGSTSSADTAAGTNTEITIPAQTVAQIVEKTGAEVTVKTSNAEVNLDKKTVEEVSKQAGTTGDVKLVVKTVEQSANKAQFELKLVTSSGTVTNFNGGEVSVTVKLNKSLANKPVICVYIDDYGRYHKVSGKKNADGTFTFTTGHFSSYAVMTEEEADKVIAEQVEEVKTLAEKIKLKASSAKTPKGNIKVTLKTKEGASSITSLQDLGYTIKYKFYRSTKKSASYKAKAEKESRTYINTQGKSGTRYYYKARVMVYDSEGNLVTKTTLKNCTYATRKK